MSFPSYSITRNIRFKDASLRCKGFLQKERLRPEFDFVTMPEGWIERLESSLESSKGQ